MKEKKENSFNDLMKIYLQAQPLTETTKRKLIDSDPIFLGITSNNLKKEDLGTCRNDDNTYNKTKILELINNLKTYYNDLTRLYNYLKGLRTKKEGKKVLKYSVGASIPISKIKDDIKALILKYNLQIHLKPLNAFKVLFEYSEKTVKGYRFYKVLGSTHVSQTKY